MTHHSSSHRFGEAVSRASRHWQAGGAAGGPRWTIAISRQAGAEGPAIAQAIADRLGWLVYDRDLVEVIADEMGLRTSLVESVDERKVGWLTSWLRALEGQPEITSSDYAHHLVHVLAALAAHGECIIVGRGAAQILPRKTTLRVRLVGPEEDRIATIQRRFDLEENEARRWIEKTDHERARFVKDHFGRNVDDASLYDLVLNTSRLSVHDCADLIVAALERLQSASEPATLPLPEPAAAT